MDCESDGLFPAENGKREISRGELSRTVRSRRALSRRTFARVLGAGLLVTFAPALSGCSAYKSAVTGKRTITDDAGRELQIPTPAELERVYFTSTLAQIFCFTLNPDLLGGSGFRFTPLELEYLPEGTEDLPYLGTLSGDGEIDREQLLVEDVQIVFSISGIELTAANISDAEDLQAQLNVPVVCLDGSFDNIANCYRKLGDIMGQAARGDELGAYCERIYREVRQAIDPVPESDRVSVYYAEGPEGLQTEPDVSQHALAFAVAGARNVAAVPENEGLGMSNVSLEQVLAWNPEVIVAWDWDVRGGADEDIRRNKNWAPIKAVQDGRVYTMPNIPFAWLDRPPGVNRLIGIQWLANLLYPQAYDIDIIKAVQDFYSLFYWADVSEEEVRGFLGNSYRA